MNGKSNAVVLAVVFLAAVFTPALSATLSYRLLGSLERPLPETPKTPQELAGSTLNTQWIEVPAPEDHTLVAAVVRPNGAGPFAAVVVLHGSEGFRPHYVQLANTFAEAGFVAVLGAWFSGSHSPVGSFPDVIACPRCPPFQGASPAAFKYVAALMDAARKLPNIRSDRVGLFGHSAGAAMAVLMASTSGGVQAVVASGGGYTRSPPGGVAAIQLAHNLAAPLLLLHGTADRRASVEGAREYERTLRELSKTVEAHYFEGAPHPMPFQSPTDAVIQQQAIGFYRAHLLSGLHPQAESQAMPAYAGPLFDAHAHIIRNPLLSPAGGRPGGSPSESSSTSLPNLLERLHQVGVSGIFLFGPPFITAQAQRSDPDFVYPYAPVPIDVEKRQLRFNDQTISFIEQQLQTGVANGIGEIPLRHLPTMTRDYKGYPADGPIALQIYDLAAKYKVPVNVHVEHEYREELERALAHNRETIIVWAHLGDGPVPLIRQMMRTHQNLHGDVSTRNPWMKRIFPVEQQSLTDEHGRLKDEWKALFEEFPDRILFGLDINTPGRYQMLEQLVAYYRSVLGQLTPSTAEKIAYGNASRLMKSRASR